MRILAIQASPRREASDSIKLTNAFLDSCKHANASIVIDTLNVWDEQLPEFDYEAIGAKYKAVKHEAMTAAEDEVWEQIQSLIQRFLKADRIVLGTPMWNFGLQAQAVDRSSRAAKLSVFVRWEAVWASFEH